VAGWIVLVAGMLGALLTAAYATRLWLLAFRGEGPRTSAEEHGREPAVMNIVLWLLAIPSLALGLAAGVLPDWFDSGSLAPSLATSVPATGAALIGVVVTYGAWRHTTSLAASRAPLGAVAAHPQGDPALSEAEAIATHEPAYGDIASAPDPADPGRLLLGPFHQAAAHGFHLDAAYRTLFVRPAEAAARLVRFLDREVVDTWVRAAALGPGLLGTLVRRTQTGNTQTYLGALVVGSLLLTVAVVLVAGNGGA
jgi:NADH-quinone oxidoreductase subunit L